MPIRSEPCGKCNRLQAGAEECSGHPVRATLEANIPRERRGRSSEAHIHRSLLADCAEGPHSVAISCQLLLLGRFLAGSQEEVQIMTYPADSGCVFDSPCPHADLTVLIA